MRVGAESASQVVSSHHSEERLTKSTHLTGRVREEREV